MRAGCSIGLAVCALLIGSHSLQNAVAEGDTRTISFHHLHTGENLTVTYKRDGRYDEDALKKINHELRDWRRNEETRIDPRVIDLLWEVNREVGGREPINIICGYRAPATNAMLRRRSRGVAQFSQHTLGKAVDFSISGVPLEAIRIAGLRLQRGGVGFYPTSGSPFVHLDVGSVRSWPRMTHDQLVRVFPNGRTVHIPSDGRPLPGYALALADLQKRGAFPSQTSPDSMRTAGISAGEKPKRSLLASLFGGNTDEDEDDEAATAPPVAVSRAAMPGHAAATRIRTVRASAPSLPASRPHPTKNEPALDRAALNKLAQDQHAREPSFALASADSKPVQLDPQVSAPPAAEAAAAPAQSGPDVFAARGLWEGPQGRPVPPASIPDAQPDEDASAVPSLGPAHMSVEPRPSDIERTGTVAPWPARPQLGTDHVPPDGALAYAAQNDGLMAMPMTRTAPPMGESAGRGARIELTSRRAVTEDGITTILKRYLDPSALATRPQAAPPTPGLPVIARTKPVVVAGTTYEDPWLRAVVVAPDLQNNLIVTAFEAPDPLQLRSLMQKPDSVVVMTFSKDPYLGLRTDRFTGTAVVFVSTVTFTKRTAMLR